MGFFRRSALIAQSPDSVAESATLWYGALHHNFTTSLVTGETLGYVNWYGPYPINVAGYECVMLLINVEDAEAMLAQHSCSVLWSTLFCEKDLI